MIDLLFSVAFYALCGYLAGIIMKTQYKWYVNVTIAVVGSFLLKLIIGILGIRVVNIFGETIICTLGGCLFIYLYNKLKK